MNFKKVIFLGMSRFSGKAEMSSAVLRGLTFN